MNITTFVAAPVLSVSLVCAAVAQTRQTRSNPVDQDQRRTLENRYTAEQLKFQRQSDEAKALWQRRSQSMVGVQAKYPTPANSAKYLHQYYALKADEAGARAAAFERPEDSQSAGSAQ